MSRRRRKGGGRGVRELGRGSHSSGRRSAHGNVREAAAFVVERTLRTYSKVEVFLAPAFGRCDPRDHGLLSELVYGTLRWKRRLDHLIAQAADRPLEKIEPALLDPLRIAAYQLFFLDRVPDHAVVHEAVEHARRATHRGGASFANAVLRRLARSRNLDDWPVEDSNPVRALAIELSHPDFLVERWLEQFGQATTRRILNANNRPKPFHTLAFRDRGGRERLAESLIDEGLRVTPSKISPLGLEVLEGNPLNTQAFARGDLYVQDEASQLAALLPAPKPSERVLDLAAAPGGKTFALLAWEPTVRATMADVSVARLGQIRQNLKRLKREQPILASDLLHPAFRSRGAQPSAAAGWDRVIVDLPCSGTGTFRKNPELKWRLSSEEIGRLSAQGLRMASRAVDLVADGGLLCLLTCSLEAEENEQMVEQLLETRRDLVKEPGERLVPCRRDVGELRDGFWRLLPGGSHDGFTAQVYRRVRG